MSIKFENKTLRVRTLNANIVGMFIAYLDENNIAWEWSI